MGCCTAVLHIPRVVGQVRIALVITIAEPCRSPGAGRILPLRLRRQPIHTVGRNPSGSSIPLRELAEVVRGIQPTHQGQQLISGLGVALVDGLEDVGSLVYEGNNTMIWTCARGIPRQASEHARYKFRVSAQRDREPGAASPGKK
jgi:hypothetical protein